MYGESIEETDQLITQGRLEGYDIETMEGINLSVHYTTGRFGKSSVYLAVSYLGSFVL